MCYGKVVTMSKKSTELVNTAKGLFSTDMRGKPMTSNVYYKQISDIFSIADDFHNIASLGFYKVGQLLVKAKKELKGDFGKLKKALAEDGLHVRQQERYMSIAKNENIKINYSKLPVQWTFWLELARLPQKDFDSIQHLINKDAKWNEIEQALGKKPRSGTTTTNVKDNRNEIFGLEYDYLRGTKKHKDDFDQFEKEVKTLAMKYPFIKLKKKNYFVEVKDMLNEEKVKDDTSSENTPKFDKQYQSTKKIEI